jgi:large subunit ribosomal protein L37e
MSKGTPSFGKHNKTTHIRCRRCGRHSYNKRTSQCAKCGFPSPKLRSFRWQWKDLFSRNRKR